MEDEHRFSPWWVRHQRWVLASVAFAFVGGLASWLYADSQQTMDAREPPQRAKATAVGENGDGGAEAPGDFEELPEPKPGEWRAQFDDKKQHFSDWLGRTRQDVTPDRRTLYLQPIGDFDAGASPDLETLAELARIYFDLPVVVRDSIDVDDLDIRKRTRGLFMGDETQWLTDDLLAALKQRLPDDAYAMLGLTMTDLWPGRGWNYVFGQAMLSERVGVYSFARYDPGPEHTTDEHQSGLDREELILLRAMKVMVHETGHMFGITHCLHYRCNMNGINSLRETNKQPLHLCPVDLKKLQHAVGFDVGERYRKLAAFFERHGFTDEADFARRRLEAHAAQ
jgi:archaemetzincin